MVLKISLDGMSRSLKFSIFIASGILFVLSLIQMSVESSLFWEVISLISGLIVFGLLFSILIKLLRPFVAAYRQRKAKKKIQVEKKAEKLKLKKPEKNVQKDEKRLRLNYDYMKLLTIVCFGFLLLSIIGTFFVPWLILKIVMITLTSVLFAGFIVLLIFVIIFYSKLKKSYLN